MAFDIKLFFLSVNRLSTAKVDVKLQSINQSMKNIPKMYITK